MSKLRLATLLLALAAMLAGASTASAKGGGGTTTCVQILAFDYATSVVDGQLVLTTSYTVDNRCVDETMSVADVTFTNNATGFVGIEARMLSYGVNTLSRSQPVGSGLSLTASLSVYAPNGKLGGTATRTVTT
jgi:hypothetical protein